MHLLQLVLGAALALATVLAVPGAAAAATNGAQAAAGPRADVSPVGYPRVVTNACESGAVGRRVLIVGDSITVFTQTALERMLTSDGWSVCIDARRSETTAGALDNYAAAGRFPAFVDVVVMATGTNDALNPTAFARTAPRARAYAAGRPLLWVSVWAHPSRLAGALADRYLAGSHVINDTIKQQIGKVRRGAVVAWHANLEAGRSRPAAFLVDGVHTTELGGRQRTALIVAALRPFRH